MALTYHYVALTDVGLRRSDNQDSGFASSRLLLIADGMGGAAAGDLASSETTNVLRRLDGPLEGDPAEALAGAVHRANDRLGELIGEDPGIEGMGTTLTAMLFDGSHFTIAHIGDSRGYRLRAGVLTQITDDHTFVQGLVDEGRLTREEARAHPHRSLILRALLGRDDNGPDLAVEEPDLGDRYLLCSDGLTDMVHDDTIAAVLGTGTIDEAAVDLIRRALEAGGTDNVTVVIAEIVDSEEEVDPGLSSADGQPQLVGAAATGPRPRTGNAATRASGDPDIESDPEELRYAPLPPSRWRWARRLLIVVIVVALLGGAGWAAYDWSQKQYFVGESDGYVAIYRGVQAQIPGLELQSLDTETEIEMSSLPAYNQRLVREGITASSLADAERAVEELRAIGPSPEPSPKTSRSSSPSDSPASP